jgi:hypothetical protein
MEGSRREEAAMQDPRQVSKGRKRTDSELRSMRLTDPSRPTHDKSSDAKIPSIQMIKTLSNPISSATQSLNSNDAPTNYRRPNSEMAHLPRITLDLKNASK